MHYLVECEDRMPGGREALFEALQPSSANRKAQLRKSVVEDPAMDHDGDMEVVHDSNDGDEEWDGDKSGEPSAT
jgi:hypothetical protein